MLQAITRKKGESFLKGDSVKTPREDIMTDAVFGGLRYFDPQQSGVALNWLMPDIVPPGCLVGEVRLWDRKSNVEPDVVIDLMTSSGSARRLIIEAKWLDNMLEARQLDDQWRVFGPGTPDCESDVYHILLVQKRIRVEPEAYHLASDELRQARHLLTWSDLSAAATKRKVLPGNDYIDKWISDVIRVINLGDGKTFTGWSDVPVVVTSPSFFQSRFWDAPAFRQPIFKPAHFFS